MSLNGKVTSALEILQAAQKLGPVLLAFSGGKDSLAVALLCTELGITRAVCEESFYFGSMAAETRILANTLGLTVRYRCRFTEAYLESRQHWIFAPTKLQSQIFARRQHYTIAEEARLTMSKVVVTGRRSQENSIKSPLYLKDGCWQCHPLHDWRLGDVHELLQVNGVVLPSMYETELGRKEGFCEWIFCRRRLFPEPYSVIYPIDAELVRRVATFHNEAKQWLEVHEN